jgi:DeoR/GlpR family transcriptional regulator of sugar metabolism
MKPRHEALMKLLRERGELDIATMVSELDASEATIRRDLSRLDEAGLLTRKFGGARLLEPSSLVVQTFAQKRKLLRREKERIARRAAEFVKPGMSIAIDSGTTTWCVAAALKERAPLKVVTTALPVIEELGPVDDIEVICVGGRFNPLNLDFVGSEVVAEFAKFRTDIAFLGVDSLVPGRGAFAETQETAVIIRATAASADRKVVVMDHTKLGTPACFLGIASDDITCLVTDAGLSPKQRKTLEAEPYELELVE